MIASNRRYNIGPIPAAVKCDEMETSKRAETRLQVFWRHTHTYGEDAFVDGAVTRRRFRRRPEDLRQQNIYTTRHHILKLSDNLIFVSRSSTLLLGDEWVLEVHARQRQHDEANIYTFYTARRPTIDDDDDVSRHFQKFISFPLPVTAAASPAERPRGWAPPCALPSAP